MGSIRSVKQHSKKSSYIPSIDSLLMQIDEMQLQPQVPLSLEHTVKPNQLDHVRQESERMNELLNRAKNITNTPANEQKLCAMKKLKKQSQNMPDSFLTGVGLYSDQLEQQKHNRSEEEIDSDVLMKSILSTEQDSLEQLRKLIRKTQNNLHSYSQSVRQTQDEVICAAESYNYQLGIGLTMKINQCNLDPKWSQKKNSSVRASTAFGTRRRQI